jgi:hypothetical protein
MVKAYFKTCFRLQNLSSASKKLGRKVLSPPFLKGDLGGLSGGYLIPSAPLKKGRLSLACLCFIWLIKIMAGIRF